MPSSPSLPELNERSHCYQCHTRLAPYLAAKALVSRIQDKSLPLGRALTLLTGKDGGPLSHMRDVYAWLVALLPDHAEQLIKAEPFGTLIYGDTGQWTVSTRRTALKLLSAYAAKYDPWFRAGAWYAPFLGGLAHPELVEDFRNILKDEPSPHVISVVLSAVEYGKPLPEMGDDLLAFIRDPDHPHLHWLKDDALRAFIRVCPEPIEECKALLEEVCAGIVKDKDQMLRAALLGELYPSEIEPHEVVHYFADANIVGRGTMGWFVRHELMEKTSDDALPVLADAILANPDDVKKLGEFDRRELNGALTRRLLEVHGNIAKPGQIYTWLGIYMDKYHSAYINKEDSVAVHDYFEAHPEFYAQLFRHWLDQTVPDEKQKYRYHHIDLQNRILLVAPPLDFPETLLTWAAAETDIDKATFLFDEAADMIMRGDPGAFGVDLEGLCEYVEVHPAFAEIWEQKRSCEISEWMWEHAQRKKDHGKEREGKRAQNVAILTPRLEVLRTGKDIENLNWGAQKWFDLGGRAQGDDTSLERIRRETNDEITEAIVKGFEALLRSNQLHTPTAIADLHCKNRYYSTFPR